MEGVVWSDYLCPWCYVGRHRSALLEQLGVSITPLPYELHPELPPEGRQVGVGGRSAAVFDRIEGECAAIGLPFRRPTRVANTRRALETAEVVRIGWPDAFPAFDDALFRAQFVDDLALDDVDVLDQLLETAGAPAGEVRAEVSTGTGGEALHRSMRAAHEAGVTATPAWLIDGRFMIPGALPPETMQRWVSRLLAKASPTT